MPKKNGRGGRRERDRRATPKRKQRENKREHRDGRYISKYVYKQRLFTYCEYLCREIERDDGTAGNQGVCGRSFNYH